MRFSPKYFKFYDRMVSVLDINTLFTLRFGISVLILQEYLLCNH